MDRFKIYSQSDIDQLVNGRYGETKLGERVQTYSDSSANTLVSTTELAKSKARFVLLGIPEDIGIRANLGIAGATTAWQPALKALMNIQSNHFLRGNEILVLGHFEIDEPDSSSVNALREKVAKIDDLVYPIIKAIVAAGKTPIVIGGGHNNCYPILKGTSLAKRQAIDVLNLDAHADLRTMEGRHSGNGFTYAFANNYLGNYFMYGLHQNYNNEAIMSQIGSNPKLTAVFFDDILKGADEKKLLSGMKASAGLEIDLDCIENVLSSASSPTGFSVNDIRKLILTCDKQFAYLHIAEGASMLLDGQESKSTAKLIAYLISDFIKTQKVNLKA
ncbi:formimidoylglutamase [Pedobacter endophyticus]|uniref:Formimidoylglutamase n=1 Tax=Pedobacter endophyticus TaxID=2789740 RepID=A0A7S9L2Z9_9SPHI|nr:formimidoylglutamase [Pedobacter endophyticus]QPH41314.1 formimidoylglutamase [Pedobacter endophyticus]